jgi:LuxR family maltose regulon positive regulatory protein
MVNGFVAGYPYISFMAASDTAYVRALRGQLSAAASGLRELISQAVRRDELHAPGSGLPYLALADICRERFEFAGTLPALAEAGARISPSNTTSYLCLMLVEARVARAQGDLAGALVSARRARFVAQQRRLSWAGALLDAFEGQVLIARGEAATAAALIERARALGEPAEFRFFPTGVLYAAEHCLAAPWQLRLALARPEELPALAAELERAYADPGPVAFWLRVKLRVLRALALAGSDAGEAQRVLHQAVALAAPEGMVCVFVEEGAALTPLLAPLAAGDDERSTYVRRLLAALGAHEERSLAPPPPAEAPQQPLPELTALPEPLSTRELDVLRLMADGQSNNEIAASLVIAVSTVKSHVNNIFSKLGVASRTQALARARRLGLL